MAETNRLRIGILGASGYTGAELVRLLARHPAAEIRLLTADRQAGRPLAEVFPHLGAIRLPDLVKIEAADWNSIDLVFCALPRPSTPRLWSWRPTHSWAMDARSRLPARRAASARLRPRSISVPRWQRSASAY